ncbi:MAG: hypothetical protein V1827_05915 [Candidatus Micrarchaeota archaeon]
MDTRQLVGGKNGVGIKGPDQSTGPGWYRRMYPEESGPAKCHAASEDLKRYLADVAAAKADPKTSNLSMAGIEVEHGVPVGLGRIRGAMLTCFQYGSMRTPEGRALMKRMADESPNEAIVNDAKAVIQYWAKGVISKYYSEGDRTSLPKEVIVEALGCVDAHDPKVKMQLRIISSRAEGTDPGIHDAAEEAVLRTLPEAARGHAPLQVLMRFLEDCEARAEHIEAHQRRALIARDWRDRLSERYMLPRENLAKAVAECDTSVQGVLTALKAIVRYEDTPYPIYCMVRDRLSSAKAGSA